MVGAEVLPAVKEEGGAHSHDDPRDSAYSVDASKQHPQYQQSEQGALEQAQEGLEGFKHGAEVLPNEVRTGRSADQKQNDQPASHDQHFAVVGVGGETGADRYR